MIEIMDTTLRDGEQTTGVSFNETEKLTIARMLLEEVRVDRIEVASARVSSGEFHSVCRICDWAARNNRLHQVEVLGFVDGGTSIRWIADAGGKVLNLLTKGSLKHVTSQLRKTPEQHFTDICSSVEMAVAAGLTVNIYLEDWSNGMIHSPDYVIAMIDRLQSLPIQRVMLPDTLGILNPTQTRQFCQLMVSRYPHIHFDFHAHNDYDFATANVFEAIQSGVKGVHTTVNGLGERAGNVPLASVVGILNDHLHLENRLEEGRLTHISRLVESFSGIRIPANKPLTGDYVFTQCSGVHADGDKKDQLYFNQLLPERFGRVRKYALGKTSGKANILKNLEELGIELDAEQMKLVTERVIELGDKKETMTTEDLPFIVADVLNTGMQTESVRVINYSLSLTKGLKPVASLCISIHDRHYEETSMGDGQYDAFMKALWKIYDRLGKAHPMLTDYWVSIPPGGKTDALVESVISWEFKGTSFKTRGLDADQTEAAIKATVRMLNMLENEEVIFSEERKRASVQNFKVV